MFTDKNGMTLYVSALYNVGTAHNEADIEQMWSPNLGAKGDHLSKGWTHVKRADGTMQLAYLGKLTYLFQGDRGKGDIRGDGLDGTWHVLND